MCGFIGALNVSDAIRKRLVDVPHRGPDGRGEYSEGSLFLRHFRLAILGSEEHASQPMTSFDGNVVLAFNGEIYNYQEIAEDMGRPELAHHGDTRVLAELLSGGWKESLSQLNGMFAFAAYFKNTGTLLLARDRIGIKPLYYAHVGSGLVFGSEIKALREVVGASLSPDAVSRYLDWGVYPSGSSTFYSQISQLSSGHVLIVPKDGGAGESTEEQYFDLRESCADMAGSSLSVSGYEDLLADSIRLRLRSDVPISLHFSGGTDSTALLVKTHEVWGEKYPLGTFTMGFLEKAQDESQFTDQYCSALGVDNRKCILEAAEVPDLAAEMHRYQDEPYGGVPTLAYMKMNRMEREAGYIVSIEGQGGDETFGGYNAHAYMAMYDLIKENRESVLLESLLHAYGADRHTVCKLAEKLIESGFSAHTDMTDLRLRKGSAEKFHSWLMTIQMYDCLVNKIPRTLRFNDRASMAYGREVRFPLLDHRVLTYGLAFSHAIKFAGGLCKAPLRSIIKRRLPVAYSVPKRSVVTPQTQWFQNQLKDWVKTRIAITMEAGVAGDVERQKVSTFFDNPEPDNSFFIWQLVNLSYFAEDGTWKG